MNIELIASIIGCITLFLYAIRQLSSIFETIFSQRAYRIIEKYTSNLFKSIVVGMATTLILDSSSAVIIFTIILINAGTLDLRRGIGIALGANIGTTFQSQLYAFDIMEYSFILLIVGLGHIFIKSEKWKQYLLGIFYIGLLFFSIFLIENLVSDPAIFLKLKLWMEQTQQTPLQMALIGGFITVVIQSSGAMVGLAISLSKQGLLEPMMGIAIMMGAELGTCSNSLIAAIGGKKAAVHLAVFNIVFNVLAITVGLIFFDQFVALIELLFQNATAARKIANAHIIFNVIAVVLVLPLINKYLKIFAINERSLAISNDQHHALD